MMFLAKLFGFRTKKEKREAKLLKLHNQLLRDAIVVLNQRISELEVENERLKHARKDKKLSSQEVEVLEQLLQEIDFAIAMENLKPVGDA